MLLTANSIVVENVGFWDLDFLSNGFKLRLNDAEANCMQTDPQSSYSATAGYFNTTNAIDEIRALGM